ncbi:MAG TPA: DOMON domain-containing protein [Spirochaetota bacterium]|nr:DOMON domain-containing protein [Spirochaetota bacterium]
MKNIKILFILCLLFTAMLNAAPSNTIQKITNAGITLEWQIQSNYLKLKISAPTTGWVAVGFEPKKMMKDADFIIGYISDGKVVIKDHYGSRYISHEPDTELGGTDDILDPRGRQQDGTTTLSCKIPLRNQDEYDAVLKPGRETTVLLAYGDRDNFRSKHKVRTKIKITL